MIIVVFGPEASGKMSVGQELKKFGFHLLFNHQVIDLVGTIYNEENIGTIWNFQQKHIDLIQQLYSSFLYSAIDDEENLVFTITWNFDNDNMKNYFLALQEYAKARNQKVVFVELYSTLEERLRRNRTPNRLEHKVCKRDVESSDHDLIENSKFTRLNSEKGEMDVFEHYLFFDNTNIPPCEVTQSIVQYLLNNV